MTGAIVEFVAIMVVPTLAFALVLRAPRALRWAHRRWTDRRPTDRVAGRRPPPAEAGPRRPPIEQLAADLRRLLRDHEAVARSSGTMMRAQRLCALEAAITDCATDAGRALGVPCPGSQPNELPGPGRPALSTAQLRRLLRSLDQAGLTLPPGVGLVARNPPV